MWSLFWEDMKDVCVQLDACALNDKIVIKRKTSDICVGEPVPYRRDSSSC